MFVYGVYDRVRGYTQGPGGPDPAARRSPRANQDRQPHHRLEREAGQPRPPQRCDACVYYLGLSHVVDRDDDPGDRPGHLPTADRRVLLHEDFLPVVLVRGGSDEAALYHRHRDRDLPTVRDPQRAVWNKHTGYEDDLFVWSPFALGLGSFLLEATRILGQSGGPQAFGQASVVGYLVATVFATVGVTPDLAAAVYPVVWWHHSIIALWFIA